MQCLNNLLIRDPCYFLGPDSWVAGKSHLIPLIKQSWALAATAHITARQSIGWWWLIRTNGASTIFSMEKHRRETRPCKKGKWVGKGKFFQRCHQCFFWIWVYEILPRLWFIIDQNQKWKEWKQNKTTIYIYTQYIYSSVFSPWHFLTSANKELLISLIGRCLESDFTSDLRCLYLRDPSRIGVGVLGQDWKKAISLYQFHENWTGDDLLELKQHCGTAICNLVTNSVSQLTTKQLNFLLLDHCAVT